MKKIIAFGLVASSVLFSLPAMAGMNYSPRPHCGGTTTDPSCPTYKFKSDGTATTTTTPSSSVAASAWYDTGTGALTSTSMTYYADQYGNKLGLGAGSGGNPEHAVGNSNGTYEWIMLSFDKAVRLDEITVGWWKDTDMTVLASNSAATNLSGWSLVENLYYNSDGSSTDDFLKRDDRMVASLSTDVCASYWLIGALNPAYNTKGDGYIGNDYFKLYSVQACTDCSPPNQGVAEPGSLALAGLGLLGVIGLRRRRK